MIKLLHVTYYIAKNRFSKNNETVLVGVNKDGFSQKIK